MTRRETSAHGLLRSSSVWRWLVARQFGLTQQMLVFIILPLAAVLIAVPITSLAWHAQLMRALVGERDERAARAASAAITEQLLHRAASVRGLALHVADAATPEQTLAEYAYLLPNFEGGLALVTAEGDVLASSTPSVAWQSRPVAELLDRSVGQREPQFSEAFLDPATGEHLLMVAATVDDRRFAVGAFAPASLARRTVLETLVAGDQAFVVIVDPNLLVLYQTGQPPSETQIALHPGVAEALGGESGATYRAVESSEHVVAYSPVMPVGWALVLEEPWEAVESPLVRGTQLAPLVLIPVFVFALVVIGFGLWQVVQPLRVLERQAREFGWGQAKALEQPVGGVAEIRHLQAELRRMAQRLAESQHNLRAFLGDLTAGQEDERRRLARELHDGTVQSLVALNQRVHLVQIAVSEVAPRAVQPLAEVREMTATLIEEVRRVIRALRPIYLEDLGLLPAIEMLVRDLGQQTGVRAMFSAERPARRLPPAQEITIYRIVQEALNNAARYAQARVVTVSVAFTASESVFRVEDDGQGFDAPERVSDLAAAGHYGLMGMQERADLIGAQLTIRSAPDVGTTVELRVPL